MQSPLPVSFCGLGLLASGDSNISSAAHLRRRTRCRKSDTRLGPHASWDRLWWELNRRVGCRHGTTPAPCSQSTGADRTGSGCGGRVTTWYSLAAGGDRSSHWGRFRHLGDTNATRSAASGWSPHMSDENSLPDHLLPCVPAKLRPQRPSRNGYSEPRAERGPRRIPEPACGGPPTVTAHRRGVRERARAPAPETTRAGVPAPTTAPWTAARAAAWHPAAAIRRPRSWTGTCRR